MKLIDKSAIVAEIEKKINKEIERCAVDLGYSQGCVDSMRNILSFIDSLEVKEVDLGKEFDNYTKDILPCDVQFQPFTHLYNCAKYFYELGIKAQKGE